MRVSFWRRHAIDLIGAIGRIAGAFVQVAFIVVEREVVAEHALVADRDVVEQLAAPCIVLQELVGAREFEQRRSLRR